MTFAQIHKKRPTIQAQDARHVRVLCKMGKNTGHTYHGGEIENISKKSDAKSTHEDPQIQATPR